VHAENLSKNMFNSYSSSSLPQMQFEPIVSEEESEVKSRKKEKTPFTKYESTRVSIGN
jgi:hypothetical protein